MTRASDAVPEMALLDAALDGESPGYGERDPSYDVGNGGQRQFSINKSGCTLQLSYFIDPFSTLPGR
jgi:hypothetical protein